MPMLSDVTSASPFVYLSLILSSGAAVANVWSFLRNRETADWMILAIALMRGFLSGCYAVAYMWLILNPDSQLHWSQTIGGFAWVSWIVAWIFPAFGLTQAQKRAVERQRKLDGIVKNLIDGG